MLFGESGFGVQGLAYRVWRLRDWVKCLAPVWAFGVVPVGIAG